MLINYRKNGIAGWKSYWFLKNITFRKNIKIKYKKIEISIINPGAMSLSVPSVEKTQLTQIMKKIFEANLKDRRF